MKISLLSHLLILSLLNALSACSSVAEPQGVIAPSPQVKSVTGVYLEGDCRTARCKAGYVIDEDGINHPAILVANSENNVFIFPSSIQSLFSYDGDTLASDKQGAVYKLEKANWVKSDIAIKPNSYVLDSQDDIVACTKPSMTKAHGRRGNCYSLEKNWSHDYSLASTAPVMCGRQLRLVSLDGGQFKVKAIDIKDGSVVAEAKVSSDERDLCEVQF